MIDFSRAIFRQFLIFISYLIFNSLFLFNHSGGADILFNFLMMVSFVIHFIIVRVKINRDKKEKKIKSWGLNDIIAFTFIVILFVLTFSQYMNFMWWLTNLN